MRLIRMDQPTNIFAALRRASRLSAHQSVAVMRKIIRENQARLMLIHSDRTRSILRAAVDPVKFQ